LLADVSRLTMIMHAVQVTSHAASASEHSFAHPAIRALATSAIARMRSGERPTTSSAIGGKS
jgi:hypothetical protein